MHYKVKWCALRESNSAVFSFFSFVNKGELYEHLGRASLPGDGNRISQRLLLFVIMA